MEEEKIFEEKEKIIQDLDLQSQKNVPFQPNTPQLGVQDLNLNNQISESGNPLIIVVHPNDGVAEV